MLAGKEGMKSIFNISIAKLAEAQGVGDTKSKEPLLSWQKVVHEFE